MVAPTVKEVTNPVAGTAQRAGGLDWNQLIEIIKATHATEKIPDAALEGGGGQTFARVVKKVDETVNNSSTLQDDDELFIALNINKVYSGLLFLLVNSSAVADLKHNFTIPTGATGSKTGGTWSSLGPVSMFDITTQFQPSTAGIDAVLIFWFRVVMGGTAGNLQLQWAQGTAEVSNTKILQGALLTVWEETA